ncbi:NepR family anti-sigma factor [Methylobacterium persicinum]|uniref:Anti-sigma factor NepR domain-containing protein n=1 Tax=Methylobacterium persicinum TaxID=374426 RepID=A0ABU0HG70_9HYPH|nr:NepR family anti-sigma factor [Methylobacterium persicinum]MDQ0441302.1 hypothetical protein [Methylobacterium persicinum]GJE36348.1 hypothetical protein KHHGKMAE_0396 [Methylobacterium persicinum]
MAQDHGDRADTATIRAGPEPGAPQRGRAAIDADSRARIGRELQRHYAQILALPIPDHLRALVDDLTRQGEASERAARELPR